MNKEILIKKIINQANSLNKKIKKFKEHGIEEHSELIHSLFNSKQMKYNDSGSLTKSKKFYNQQNILQLQRTLNMLIKINNHDVYGTINKYVKTVNQKYETFVHTIEQTLINKGYNHEEVKLITSTKWFVDSVGVALKDISKGYGSNQVIEKVFLQYSQEISKEDIEKVVSDIEYSARTRREVRTMENEFKQFLASKRGKR